MRSQLLLSFLGSTAIACSHSPTAPTQAALSILVSPNPIAGPTANAHLVYTVRFQETAGLGVRLDRFDERITDAAGTLMTSGSGSLSQSSGCTTCTRDLRVAANATFNWGQFTQPWRIGPNGESLLPCCGLQPSTFSLTVYYTDDHGNALHSNAQVPIQ